MTQPPFETGGTPPSFSAGATPPTYDTGAVPPAAPPGFGPPVGGGRTPWGPGRPLAAGGGPSRKKFVLVMAFFATLLVVSVVGFVVTAKDDFGRARDRARDAFGNAPFDRPHATAAPETEGVPEPTDEGPVPKPVTYRGTGSKVVKLRRPAGNALVYVKGRPSGPLFTVYGVAADGTRTGFAITATGPYEGVRLLDVTTHLRTTQLEIEASGPWTVQVRSERAARSFDSSVRGRGDDVLRYTGPGGVAAIRGGAPMQPFLVMARDGDFPRPVVIEVGRFDGEKVWPRGPVLVEVQSQAAWSIRVRGR